MTLWGRRAITFVAAFCALCVHAASAAPIARAADCPVPRPGDAGTLLTTSLPGRPMDWVMVVTMAGPSGARGLDGRGSIAFDHAGASAAIGMVFQPFDDQSITMIDTNRHNRRHDIVRVGNVTVERRARQSVGPSGGRYQVGFRRQNASLRPCQSLADLFFLPGARVAYASADLKTSGGSARAFVFGGRGGGAALASDAESRLGAVIGGMYAGHFRASWTSDHGIVGGLSMSCRNCAGSVTAPTNQTTSFGYLDEPEYEPIVGPAGRWRMTVNAMPSGGSPALSSPLIAAWAEVGELRQYFARPRR